MLNYFAFVLAIAAAGAQSEVPRTVSWDVTSKVVAFSAPGVPGFIARMVRGKSKAEHKRLRPDEGVEALLAPDPKAHCQIGSQRIASGRYTQALICPQKNGKPLQIARSGTYNASGFVGWATVNGTTSKGTLRIVLDQRAVRIGN